MEPANNKAEKLFEEYLDFVSSSEESEAFLKGEGLDPEKLVNEAIRKAKLVQLQLASHKTEREFLDLKSNLLLKAKQEAEKLLADISFNLEAFIKKEKLNVAFKNFEKLTPNEVKEFLEWHFLLKMENELRSKNGQ